MNVAIIIIDSFIMSWIIIFVGTKFLDRKINYKSGKFWITYLLYTLYLIISYMTTNSFIRVVVTFMVISFLFAILYNISFIKSLVLGFIVSAYISVSEIIFVLIITILLKTTALDIQNFYFGSLIANVSIALIMFLLTYFKPLDKWSKDLIGKFNIKSYKIVLVFTLLSLITLALILYYVYFEIDFVGSLSLGIILIVIFTCITFGLFTEKIDNHKLKTKYDSILDNLSEYEKMYSLQVMRNHEYKNNLLILRGMLKKDNQDVTKYIDEIIDLRSDSDHNWMEILKRIPEGGLQGLLYYKLLQCQELNINIDFTTTRFYNPTSYSKLPEKVKIEVCKLLGIYLDNSIQAVEDLDDKNIYININENDKYIIFKIANNFAAEIDLDKINDKGYTTKKLGNGYGLSIAQEIITNNSYVENRTKVIRDKFIQEIEIKKQLA